MNRALANGLGRPDLAPDFNSVMLGGNGGAVQYNTQGPSASYQASVGGDVSLGQMSLSMLVISIVALGAFYVWTRGSQA